MRLFIILQNLDNVDSGTKKLGSEIPIVSRKPSLNYKNKFSPFNKTAETAADDQPPAAAL